MNKLNFKEISVHDSPKHSPGFLLWHISTAWRGYIEKTLKTINLTHPQFVILATLGWLTRQGDKVTQATVGKMARLDPNTVSQIIRGLEKKELILRKKSPDGRAKNPVLTHKGSDILKQSMPAVEKKDAEFFQNLTKDEIKSMVNIFQKLIKRAL
ncbi:MAG: putative HTH-type transcriptional regulator [Chlamydiae bacterium]|nr:putative HTH-type transcriptional regulator [Chlamydiota bacterium]